MTTQAPPLLTHHWPAAPGCLELASVAGQSVKCDICYIYVLLVAENFVAAFNVIVRLITPYKVLFTHNQGTSSSW